MLILISAVLAYPSGIVAVRRLGSSLASFVSLTEVIFAVVFAFVLLGQRPGLMQLLGGVLILAGIALVQRPARRRIDRPDSLRQELLPKSVTNQTLPWTESLITSMPTSTYFLLKMFWRWPSLGGFSLYIAFCTASTPSCERRQL